MSLPTVTPADDATLPALVERAANRLASAKSAAEILEAREMAGAVYDVAKRAARLARAKDAHDDLLARIYRSQADAMDIEARAKRRLADEYDAAQERGEVAKLGTNQHGEGVPHGNTLPDAADIGISRKAIHEARAYRDAEAAEPGIVRRVSDEAIAAGQEPTKARVRRAVYDAAGRHVTPPPRGNEAYCIRVRDAMLALSGLPDPTDVARYFNDHPHLAAVMDGRLESAAEWLIAFADEWRRNHDQDHD